MINASLILVLSRQLFSGLVVTTFNVAGFLGSILIAMLANRTKALTPINKLAKGLGVVSSIAMMEVSAKSLLLYS